MLVSGCGRRLEHYLVHLSRKLFIGNRLDTTTNMVGERRSLMHLQKVERKMFGTKRKCFIEIAMPSIQCLTRQAGNQIEADIVKAGITQVTKCLTCFLCRVRTSQPSQLGI